MEYPIIRDLENFTRTFDLVVLQPSDFSSSGMYENFSIEMGTAEFLKSESLTGDESYS